MIENLIIQRQQWCKGLNKERKLYLLPSFSSWFQSRNMIKRKGCWILTKQIQIWLI